MRLALVGPTYPFRGGISHYTTLLCAELRKRHQVDFFSYTRQYPRWLFPGETDIDPSTMPLQVAARRVLDPLNPLTWVRAVHAMTQAGLDGILLPWTIPYWAPMLAFLAFWVRRLSRARVVFICHNVLPHERHQWDVPLGRLTLAQGDRFIVHSESDRAELLKLIPGARVLRATIPVYNAFPPGPDSAAAKAQLGLSGPVLLFFGFIRPYKGLRTLLQALPLALQHLPMHLLIVGEFWEDRAVYERIILENHLAEHVTIVGRYVPNEEVGIYFAAADVVVLPYESATQSAVVPLAYGYGRPVISTRVGGLPEVIREGETGFLVPPSDPQALAEGIVRFFKEDRGAAFAHRIREMAPVIFGWEGLVRQIEALILEDKAVVESR